MSRWLTLALVVMTFTAAHAGQHVIRGTVRDFDGHPIVGAEVEIKSATFKALYTAKTDAEGRYSMTVDEGRYLALESIKPSEYGKSRLEFWAWNVPVTSDLTIDIRYHRLEIYGVNVFKVQGGRPGLFAYFRPMSLTRVPTNDPSRALEVAPPPADLDLAIEVNGAAATIDTVERVQEFTGKGSVMFAYLVHFTPISPSIGTDVIRIVGRDKANGDRGEAMYFYAPPDYRN